MGEYADMHLEGDVCHDCGVFLPGESPGHPRWCRDCRKAPANRILQSDKPLEKCPSCGKKLRLGGLAQHTKDKHGR